MAPVCFVAQAGSCGELLFTRFGGGFGDTTRYYAGSGTLVAVHATSDAYAVGVGLSELEALWPAPVLQRGDSRRLLSSLTSLDPRSVCVTFRYSFRNE